MKEKMFKVMRYTGDKVYDHGLLPKSIVDKMLKGYKFDKELEMYFSKRCKKAYSIEEVEEVE